MRLVLPNALKMFLTSREKLAQAKPPLSAAGDLLEPHLKSGFNGAPPSTPSESTVPDFSIVHETKVITIPILNLYL